MNPQDNSLPAPAPMTPINGSIPDANASPAQHASFTQPMQPAAPSNHVPSTSILTNAGHIAPTPIPLEDNSSDDGADIEWIMKAKEIVGRTSADPFLRSNELSKLKAHYLKTRYNKDIKLSDGSS